MTLALSRRDIIGDVLGDPTRGDYSLRLYFSTRVDWINGSVTEPIDRISVLE